MLVLQNNLLKPIDNVVELVAKASFGFEKAQEVCYEIGISILILCL